jgi:linoleoyl-CoA desaturase
MKAPFRKLSYGKVKSPQILWTTLIITSNLFRNLVSTNAIRYCLWQVLLDFFIMHYTAGLIFKYCFSVSYML